MKVAGLKWGYDGDHMSCGPTEGNTIVELALTEENKSVFVAISRVDCYEKISVSDHPLFDELMNLFAVNDFEEALQRVESNLIHLSEVELSDADETEIDFGTQYDHTVRFAQWIMHMYYMEDTDMSADELISAYIGKDIEEIDIPNYQNPYEDERIDGERTQFIAICDGLMDEYGVPDEMDLLAELDYRVFLKRFHGKIQEVIEELCPDRRVDLIAVEYTVTDLKEYQEKVDMGEFEVFVFSNGK